MSKIRVMKKEGEFYTIEFRPGLLGILFGKKPYTEIYKTTGKHWIITSPWGEVKRGSNIYVNRKGKETTEYSSIPDIIEVWEYERQFMNKYQNQSKTVKDE